MLIENVLYILRNLVFLSSVVGIILYEYGKYLCWGNFNNFIVNILNKLSQKNILYIKLFQACALNTTIIDPAFNDKLVKFCDNAPWTIEDIDMDTLWQLEKTYQMHIVDKHEPINTGMISLVYKGTSVAGPSTSVAGPSTSVAGPSTSVAGPSLKVVNGQPLIIKIKRKNIETRLNAAIDNVLFFLALIDYIPFINTCDFPAVIKKNINLITQQLNFNNEVSNITKFQTYCQRLKYIKIPTVYPAVTKRFANVILMEYVQGQTIHNIDKADYEIYAKQLMKFVYITTFLYGIYHGDLHLGNILFLKEAGVHKLCILDFGLVYEVEKTKDAVFDIVSSIIMTPPAQIADKILQSGILEPVEVIRSLSNEHYTELINYLTNFVNTTIHIDKKLNHHQIFPFLSNLNTYITNINKHHVHLRISDDLIKMQVFFAMNHGVMLTLCTDINYMELSDQVMKETFHLDVFI